MALGETPSAGMVSNARSLSKIASGLSLKDGQWMNSKTWDAFHGNTKILNEQWTVDCVTNYTQSGIHAFDMNKTKKFRKARNQELTVFDKHLSEYRHGWFGWIGYGGAVFQWNPQHKVGFSYVPTDLLIFDIMATRAAKLQQLTIDILTKGK